MAGEAKITKKVIDEVSEAFSKLEEKELAFVAKAVGQDTDFVKQVQDKPGSKQSIEFFKSLVEKTKGKAKTAKEMVDGAQSLFDRAVGRAPRTDEDLTQIGKAAAEKAGGAAPPAFEPSAAKFVGEGGRQVAPKPMASDVNYTFGRPSTGEPGGPLVPVTPPGRLQTVSNNLTDTEVVDSPRLEGVRRSLTPGVQDAERVSTGLVPGGQVRTGMSQEELADLARQAKPGTPGQGVTERMPRNRPSLSDEFDARMGFDEVTGAPKSVVPKKAAGLGAAAAAGAAALASAGFSKEANAPVVVKEAAVDKPEDIAPLLEKAKKNVEPGKQAALVQQAQQVTQVAKSIEELFKEVRDENRDKQARIELMKVTETIMHGLVTAIGANALLNRNSPFAVDFSQGPKTDWNSQFDRLQKQFDTQIGFLTQKYKIEEAGKRAVARETQRQAERKEDLAFKEKELAAKQQGQATSAAEAQEKKKETAIANATGIIEKISALDKEKDSQQLATARGQLYKQAKALLPKEELVQVEERAAALFNAEKSKWKEFFRSIGLASQEPSKKEYGQMTDAFARALNEKINPAPGFAGQAAPAETEQERKERRRQELLRKARGE